MKKIKLLALLVAGATLSPITLAQTTLQYWTLLNGGDGARMKQLVDGFNASQGDYKIETTTLNPSIPNSRPPLPWAAVRTWRPSISPRSPA